MSRKLSKVLSQLGLSKNEIKVYLALLAKGDSGVSQISDASSVKRTTVYSVLEQLQSRQLVRSYIQAKKERFSSISPHQLLERQLQLYSDLETILPALDRLYSDYSDMPYLTVYKTSEEIEELWGQLFTATTDIYSYINLDSSALVNDENRHFQFIKYRLDNNLLQRCLVSSSESLSKFLDADSIVLRKSVESPLDLQFDIHIYEDKLCIVYANGYTGFIIESPQIKEAIASVFELMWTSEYRPRQEISTTSKVSNHPPNRQENYLEAQETLKFNSLPNLDKTLADLRSGKRDPRTIPIPNRTAFLASFDYDQIQASDLLDSSRLVDLLDQGFKGISYYKTVAKYDQQFNKNIENAENKVRVRASVVDSLCRVNKFLNSFDVSLYLLGGYRSRDCQEEIWNSMYERTKKSLSSIYKGAELTKVSKDYTNRYVTKPAKKIAVSDPKSWYMFSTGGALVTTLAAQNGYPLELGIQTLDLSMRSHPYFFETTHPRYKVEYTIQQNRRLLFWAMLLEGWIASPTHIGLFNVCNEHKTQVGIVHANVFGVKAGSLDQKATLGPVEAT